MYQLSKLHINKIKANYFAGIICYKWQAKGRSSYNLIQQERLRGARSKIEGERGERKGKEGVRIKRAIR